MDISTHLYMKNIHEMMLAKANLHLKEYDLTLSQMCILLYCNNSGADYVLQKDLEDYFNLSHATIIGILKRLSQKGYIKIEISDAHKRQRRVYTTKKTLAMKSEIEEHIAQFEKILIKGFSKKDIAAMQGYLAKMYENLKKSDFVF